MEHEISSHFYSRPFAAVHASSLSSYLTSRPWQIFLSSVVISIYLFFLSSVTFVLLSHSLTECLFTLLLAVQTYKVEIIQCWHPRLFFWQAFPPSTTALEDFNSKCLGNFAVQEQESSKKRLWNSNTVRALFRLLQSWIWCCLEPLSF